MNCDPTSTDRRRFVASEAARWFARELRGPLSTEDRSQLDSWLQENADHAHAYEACRQISNSVKLLASDPELRETLTPNAAPTQGRTTTVRRASFWGSLAASMVIASALGYRLMHYPESAPLTHAYSTAIGEQRTVELLDGSSAQLNTHTKLRMTVGAGYRRIDLEEGEAFFNVTKDPARPFSVLAMGHSVNAVGTEFNVHLQDDRATVIVLEGIVTVSSDGREPIRLTANQQLDFTRVGNVIGPVSVAQMGRALGWRDGKLSFDAASLGQVLKELNRYSPVPIVLTDQSLSSIQVSGEFETDSIESVLHALQTLFGLQVIRMPGYIEVSGGR
ncbi:FecR family protein [Povalibacter sp.]|uniref:FecR family protein n=1 Tax=Povalibacter sp. TaxID=1962978 RepID=UPI002F421DBE